MERPASSSGSTVFSDELQQASLSFSPDATRIDAIPGHPDISLVETPAGILRVRRWPRSTPASDVAFTHETIGLAREAGLAIIPEIVSLPGDGGQMLHLAGRLYDAQRWMPGTPPVRAEAAWPELDDRVDLPGTLAAPVAGAVITTLATLHAATSGLASRPDIPTAPLSMLPGAVRQAHGRHLGALRARAPREPAIQRWLATGERLIANAEPIVLRAAEENQLPAAVLHLDLWPAHVLIEDEALSGLLGWRRVAVGSPLLDLAQAILRLHGWSDDIVETVIGTYSETRPLAPEERRLLPAVAALDAVASTGRLLEQTFVPGVTERPPTAVRGAIDMMLRSMAALDRNLTVPAEKKQWRPSLRQPSRSHVPARGGQPRERRHPA